MSFKTDMHMAIKLGALIADKGFSTVGVIALRLLDTGVFEITYSLDYPPARVVNGKVVWPKGSPTELVWGIFGG